MIGKHLVSSYLKSNAHNIRCINQKRVIRQILDEKSTEAPETVKGWVTSVRKMKDLIFIDVNDGSTSDNLQVVLSKDATLPTLIYGSSVEATGQLNTNRKGQLELAANSIKVLGTCDAKQYPFTYKQKHSHDYCRQYLHFRPSLPHFKSLLRIRHRATMAVHKYFDDNDFIHLHTPILTSNDCEGGGEVFKVQPLSQQLVREMKKKDQLDESAFFGNIAYLSVSGQLHLESATRGLSKVYSFSPTFRAENSKSRLHLSEFYMIESEEAFLTSLNPLLDMMEDFVKVLIKDIVGQCSEDIAEINKYDGIDSKSHLASLEKISSARFLRMSFEDACSIVEKNSDLAQCDCRKDGFSKEQELYLVESAGNVPVFVTNWPQRIKPFYMKRSAEIQNTVEAVDLLVPNVGELCGGSLREDDFEILKQELRARKLEEEMKWYLDLREFGNVPTGGFGMGFERFLQLITGITNIKDTIPFPRWPHSLKM